MQNRLKITLYSSHHVPHGYSLSYDTAYSEYTRVSYIKKNPESTLTSTALDKSLEYLFSHF